LPRGKEVAFPRRLALRRGVSRCGFLGKNEGTARLIKERKRKKESSSFLPRGTNLYSKKGEISLFSFKEN